MPRITNIQVRRDTAANWTSTNPTLASGEIGLETDTGKFKFGNGTSNWTSLTTYAANQVGTTSGLIVKTTTGGALTTLAAGSSGQFLQYDGTWATPSYPTLSSLGAVSQTNGTVTTASTSSGVVRNIFTSTSNPSGGMDGDVWLVYSP